jgi:Swt1-like HEPN
MQTNDYVRSFGMSGLLISEDLKAIEQQFDVELGHTPKASQQSAADYYPQFEHEVRREAAQMAQHYELFYCLEQAIRKLITETLEEAEGANWWDTKVSTDIQKYVSDLQKGELDNGITPRSDRAIDYTTFGHLSVVITSNWSLFATIFKSQRAVQKVMASLNMLRGPIAHCCPLSEDEVDRLDLAVRDWFRMMG